MKMGEDLGDLFLGVVFLDGRGRSVFVLHVRLTCAGPGQMLLAAVGQKLKCFHRFCQFHSYSVS